MQISGLIACAVILHGVVFDVRAQDIPVPGKEIQAEWTGRTLTGRTAKGAAVTMKLLADGTATLAVGNTSDSGTWRAPETGYCTTWKTIRAGEERCFTVRRSGSKLTVFNPDGSVSGYFDEIK